MKKLIFCISCFLLVICSCNKDSGTSTTISGNDSIPADSEAVDTIYHSQNLPTSISVAMVGDVEMGYTFPHDRLPANDGNNLFDDCRDILKNADVACGNLEGVLSEGGANRKPLGAKHMFMFKMPPRYTRHLKNCGFDFMGLANNHIFDFYDVAIKETQQNLDSAGIGYAGCKDQTGRIQYPKWCIKDINGVKYGFSAFGHEPYELCTYDTETVKEVVKYLRSKCDIVIICFHGGAEGTSKRHLPEGTEYYCGENRGDLRAFTHLCIDLGADVVYGSGPHVPRCIELYKGHFIAYSLGNFCTCGMGIGAQTGYAPLITININGKDGKFIDGKIHAFRQGQMTGPKTDKSGAVIRDIRELTQADIKDSKLNIADNGNITIKK